MPQRVTARAQSARLPPTVTSALSVCLLDITMSCAKTAEPIKMPLGCRSRVGPGNRVLGWARIPLPSAERAICTGVLFYDAAFRQNSLTTCCWVGCSTGSVVYAAEFGMQASAIGILQKNLPQDDLFYTLPVRISLHI